MRRVASWWTGYDVLVTPTVNGEPPLLGALDGWMTGWMGGLG